MDTKPNLKVIHGTMEIANQMYTMVAGLKKLGVDAKALCYYSSAFRYPSEFDQVMNIRAFQDIQKAVEASKEITSKTIPEYDVFHLHFSTSLALDYSDLPLLKAQNKKVLMHHWGSDVRKYSQAVKRNPYVKVKVMNENIITRKLALLSKYIDTCIVSDGELYEYVKDDYSNVEIIPQVIKLDEYAVLENEYKNKKITLVHAPTSPEMKGTSYILKAVEQLQDKYDFNFKLVQGVRHEEAKKIYAKADLVIDQILIGTYGIFAIESMCLGKPVICWISDFMKEKYPDELPIISANPSNIKEKLEFLLNNRDCLKEIGEKSRRYVEKYHDINKISPKLLNLYRTL